MKNSATAADSRAHVVIVDDQEDLCELLTLRLEHHGFRASSAHTIRGGLDILERETIDAMIVDLRLEAENGLDLLSAVLKHSAALPVIMLTAHGTIETAVEAMGRGAYGFLTKPFDDKELLQKVSDAVERGRLAREAGIPLLARGPNGEIPSLREAREAFDHRYLEEVLARSGGNVSAAAKLAGRNRTDFHELLRRHEISSADFRDGGSRQATTSDGSHEKS